jgi:hypothetical protein
MLLTPSGQPLLLSTGTALLGATLLGIGLSAGVFAAAVGYGLFKRSRETGESVGVLLQRLRADLAATGERAQARWKAGVVRAAWRTQRRAVLRAGGGLLAAELLVVLGVATSRNSWLGAGNVWFAVTVMVLACLLVNSVLALLWLAGPKEEGSGQPVYEHDGHVVVAKAMQLINRKAAPKELPEAS